MGWHYRKKMKRLRGRLGEEEEFRPKMGKE
jgi:hypothetical protein